MNNSLLLLADPTSNSLPLLIILGVFLVAMIAFTIIPQRRKQKQMLEMSSRIKVGDKIKTIGGIYGTITAFDEENNVYTIQSGNSSFEIDRVCVYSMEMLGSKLASVKIEDVIAEEKTDEVKAENEVKEEIASETSSKDNKNEEIKY